MPDKRQNRRSKPKISDKKPTISGQKQPAACQNVNNNTASASEAAQSTSDVSPIDVAARFESELVWCIEHLQIGIGNDKTGGRKAQDAVKILKILENPKAPLVKKRQAMRAAFGDYRKKMEEDEKKYSTNAKKMRIEAVSSSSQVKPVVYKKSHTIAGSVSSSVLEENASIFPKEQSETDQSADITHEEHNQLPDSQSDAGFHFAKSDNAFKFDFSIENNVSKSTDIDVKENVVTASNATQKEPNVNFYKMQSSKENFAFNFSVSENS